MKKFLFGILTFLGIGLSFCSADGVLFDGIQSTVNLSMGTNSFSYPDGYNCFFATVNRDSINFYDENNNLISYLSRQHIICNATYYINNYDSSSLSFSFFYFPDSCFSSSTGTCEDKDITVFYNSGSSTSITCDGIQAIEIQGLSTITSTNTFTPYFNIDYKDEDNQSLVESYSKDILYLSGTTFKKTYTGNNERILTSQGGGIFDSEFTGYVPVFDVTGSTQPIDTEYNMFNNFADNSLQVLLSNIPGYVQYIFITGIILLLLGIVKMFKRRK